MYMCFYINQSQDVRLLFTKFKLLEEKERVPEFVEVGAEMLIFYFRDFFHRNDLKGWNSPVSFYGKIQQDIL